MHFALLDSHHDVRREQQVALAEPIWLVPAKATCLPELKSRRGYPRVPIGKRGMLSSSLFHFVGGGCRFWRCVLTRFVVFARAAACSCAHFLLLYQAHPARFVTILHVEPSEQQRMCAQMQSLEGAGVEEFLMHGLEAVACLYVLMVAEAEAAAVAAAEEVKEAVVILEKLRSVGTCQVVRKMKRKRKLPSGVLFQGSTMMKRPRSMTFFCFCFVTLFHPLSLDFSTELSFYALSNPAPLLTSLARADILCYAKGWVCSVLHRSQDVKQRLKRESASTQKTERGPAGQTHFSCH